MNSMTPDFPPVRGRKKRILIVDDSAAVRQALSSIIESDPALEVMGVAADPYVAAQRIRDEVPDAIILDIEKHHKNDIFWFHVPLCVTYGKMKKMCHQQTC